MITKGTALYLAIENAVFDMFNEKIPLNNPTETTKILVENVNKELEEKDEEI